MAEKAVQTAKILIMNATASGRYHYNALLEYRTTPISDCGKSPAQLLMSRRLRYILPWIPDSLEPVLVNPDVTQQRFEEKQQKQNMFHDDRKEKTRAGISVGEHILLRKHTGGYQSAVVIEKADTPRSYIAHTKDAGDVPRIAAPEALRYEIPSDSQLPVTRRPRITTVSPPNQPAEVPVADIPVVPSEVNNLSLRSYMDGYINCLSDTKLELDYICETL